MRISDWSSDVCSSDLLVPIEPDRPQDLWALRHAWRAQTGTDPGTADGWNVTERAARLTPVQPLTVHGPGRGHPALVAQGIEHRFPKRSEENTSELQSLMRISSAVFCLKKKNKYQKSHKDLRIQNIRSI